MPKEKSIFDFKMAFFSLSIVRGLIIFSYRIICLHTNLTFKYIWIHKCKNVLLLLIVVFCLLLSTTSTATTSVLLKKGIKIEEDND